jgi:hypothetical protein
VVALLNQGGRLAPAVADQVVGRLLAWHAAAGGSAP